jgi:hypothetical protein
MPFSLYNKVLLKFLWPVWVCSWLLVSLSVLSLDAYETITNVINEMEYAESVFVSSSSANRSDVRVVRNMNKSFIYSFIQWLCSPLLGPGLFFSFVIIFHIRYDSLDEGSVCRKAARTGQHKCRINAHTDIHALSGIGTQGLSVWDTEDISCLIPRGSCDRHMNNSTCYFFKNSHRLRGNYGAPFPLLWYHWVLVGLILSWMCVCKWIWCSTCVNDKVHVLIPERFEFSCKRYYSVHMQTEHNDT